jgi:hypothetical protein
MSPALIAQCAERIRHAFPDASLSWVKERLEEHARHPGWGMPQVVEAVVEEMTREEYPRETAVVRKLEEEASPLLGGSKAAPAPVEDTPEDRGVLQSFFKRWSKPAALTPTVMPASPAPSAVSSTERKDEVERVDPRATERLNASLAGAIKECNPHSGQKLQSSGDVRPVQESMITHCDASAAMRLERVAFAPSTDGLALFVDRDMEEDTVTGDARLMAQYATFSGLLRDIGGVFTLDPDAMHVFYDVVGPTIAFHQTPSGSLFFNLRFFVNLHAEEGEGHGMKDPYAAFIYWYLTFCHELAHHFVRPHNSQHEFYLKAFAERYMRPVHQMMRQRGVIHE